jgi:hypothetical protein
LTSSNSQPMVSPMGSAFRMVEWAKRYALACGLFAAGLAVIALGCLLGWCFNRHPQPNFGLDIAKATLTLGSGFILSGAVKVMLDRYQQTQKDRQEDHELRERLLADLRGVYDRAETARLMVAAHRSAEAYGEQMRGLIGCHVVLLKVRRTLDLRPGSTRSVDTKGECLADMVGYLQVLQDEYAKNFSVLADCEGYDEAVTHRRLSQLARVNTRFDPGAVAASHHAWDLMTDPKRFPALDDLRTCGEWYTKKFRRPLDNLAAQLLGTSSRADDGFDCRVKAVVKQISEEAAARAGHHSNPSGSSHGI